MTYEQFKTKVAEETAKTERLNAEIEALINQKAKLTDEILAAAAAGDLELYESKVEAQEKVDRSLTVKKAFLANQVSTITEKDARSAWANYVSDYNKRLKSGLAEYQKAKAALCAMYGSLIELQKAALKVREEISADSGTETESFELDCIPFHNYGNGTLVRLSGFGCSDPDAVFYLADYTDRNNIPPAQSMVNYDPCYTKTYNVLVEHKSK